MQVRRLMTSEVNGIPRSATLTEAAERMKTLDVGVLPVWQDAECVGMVTDRDIVVRAIARGLEPKATSVEEAMTPQIVYCYEDQDDEEAARIMGQNQVRRLVVLNRENKLVGILSLGDLATGNQKREQSGETLREVSEP